MTPRRILAASGFVMLAYVVVHLGGNLLAFAGASTFDAYALWLRDLGGGIPLLGVRIVLACSLIAHLGAHAWMLFRPVPVDDQPQDARRVPDYVANSGFIPLGTGAIIAMFIAGHLAQLTFGASMSSFDPAAPYRNLVGAQSSWPVALGYVVAAVAVGAHLVPGTWSGIRTLGWMTPATDRFASVLSPLLGVVIAVGLSTVPLAVALGILRA